MNANGSHIPRTPPLVGRHEERAVLESVRRDHFDGHGRLLGVVGAPGMGKTSLLADHARILEEHNVRVIWVRATAIDQIRPFGCLLDVLDCRLTSPDPARRRVAEAAAASADVVMDPFRFDTDSAWRFPVQEAVVDYILDMVEAGPTMLAIDDVQWADSATLGVILALARRCSSTSLVIAWTRRASFPCDVIDQISDRHRDRVVAINLAPLRMSEARELGATLLGHELDPETLRRLARAGGNPFFVTAVMATDTDSSTPHEAVMSWIRQIPTATSDLMGMASIFGGAFSIDVLGAMTDQSASNLVSTLEPAVEAGLLQASGAGRYAFAHDLIQSALHEDLPVSLRRALHRDAAKVLMRLSSKPGIVAHHLARGARPGDEEAAEQIRAACAQVVLHDATSASDLLGRAVALCAPGSPTWASLICDQVTALQWAGRAQAALELANEAIGYSMPKAEMAKIRIVRATSLGLLNDIPASAAEYRLIAGDVEIESSVRAQILAELSTLEVWGLDRDTGRKHAQDALVLARECGALRAELQTLCALSTSDLFDGRVKEAVSYAREAVVLGREQDMLTPARELYLGLALATADELDEAAIWLRSGQATADGVSDLWLVSRYQLARMSIGLSTGDWDATVADAEAVITLHADTGMATGMPQAPSTAGMVAIRRHAPASEIARYRSLATSSATAGAEPAGLLYFGWFEALFAEYEGRIGDAAATLRFVYDSAAASAPLAQMWLAPDLVRVLLAAEHIEQASAVAASTATFAKQIGVASAVGTARWCESLVARHQSRTEVAVARAAEAAGMFRDAGRKPLLLDVLDLLSTITPSRAIDQERRQLTVELDMRAEQVAGEVRFAVELTQLTETERVIAQLVAEGLTNPAIALRLGVSKRTVEHHMSNVYVKLGVTSRVALAVLGLNR